MKKKLMQFVDLVKKDKAVENVVGFVVVAVVNTTNSGSMFITLKALSNAIIS